MEESFTRFYVTSQHSDALDILKKAVGYANSMHDLKGEVRYRFRSEEHDVDVLIEGDAEWVRDLLSEMGISDVGWMMPLAVSAVDTSPGIVDMEGDVILQKPKDMGPEPDPERIPVVRRPIGSLDLGSKLNDLGVESPVRPEAWELAEALDEMEEPYPIQDPMSKDPMAESWLREMMRLAVRSFGVTALSTETIQDAGQGKLGGREGMELESWLEMMFRFGKLVKVHGGSGVGWGPNPRWLTSP